MPVSIGLCNIFDFFFFFFFSTVIMQILNLMLLRLER